MKRKKEKSRLETEDNIQTQFGTAPRKMGVLKKKIRRGLFRKKIIFITRLKERLY